MYLGAQIKECQVSNQASRSCWSMSAEKVLKEAIQNLELDQKKVNK
jgi:hypothetical protein